MDISNYKKAKILATLYNNAGPMGLGFLHADDNNMTVQEAEKLL